MADGDIGVGSEESKRLESKFFPTKAGVISTVPTSIPNALFSLTSGVDSVAETTIYELSLVLKSYCSAESIVILLLEVSILEISTV